MADSVYLSAKNFNRIYGEGIMESREIKSYLQRYFLSCAKKDGSVSFPTLSAVLTSVEGVRDQLIDAYDKYMYLEKGYENIPLEVKEAQGAMFDGLCFVYDTQEESVSLFTMNYGILHALGIEGKDLAGAVMKKNKEFQIKGYRLDVDYYGVDGLNIKPVNARVNLDVPKKDTDSDKRYFMVPFAAVEVIMSMLTVQLNSGKILKVVQSVSDGGEKTRYVTTLRSVLGEFSDDPVYTETQDCAVVEYPLGAFMYVPVVGASSITSQKTRINVLNLLRVQEVEKLEVKREVRVAADPVKELVADTAVTNAILMAREKYEANGEDFNKVTRLLPKGDRLGDGNEITAGKLAGYLHGLSGEEHKTLLDITKTKRRISRVYRALNPAKRVPSKAEEEDLAGLLKGALLRILLRKSDGSLSSVVCTNNTDLLEAIYGENYFRRFESFSSRFYAFMSAVRGGDAVRDSLRRFGFHFNAKLVEEVSAVLDDEEKVKYILAADEGVNLRRSNSSSESNEKSSAILVRSLGGYINPVSKKAEEFYRMIDSKKIESIMILAEVGTLED